MLVIPHSETLEQSWPVAFLQFQEAGSRNCCSSPSSLLPCIFSKETATELSYLNNFFFSCSSTHPSSVLSSSITYISMHWVIHPSTISRSIPDLSSIHPSSLCHPSVHPSDLTQYLRQLFNKLCLRGFRQRCIKWGGNLILHIPFVFNLKKRKKKQNNNNETSLLLMMKHPVV